MQKEKLFSKLNITNYNNELEDILEKKLFSEGVKNILLNILYKMENAYDDYKKVKVETRPKKDVLENIINIISKKCKEIELIKPKLNEETVLKDKKFIIENNKIISYPNERAIYYGLCSIQKDLIKINKEYTILQKPLEKLFNYGYIMDLQELIRDFDGWAWNIAIDDIDNLTYNLVFQNIKMLVGEKFIQDCINNKVNFIEKLEKKLNILYGEELANEIKEKIYLISIIEYMCCDSEKQNEILKEKEKLKRELNKISNKKEYLQELANRKKEIAKKIKIIDEALSSKKTLKEMFIKEKDKVANIGEFAEKLQNKRKELLRLLRKYGNLMKPMNYVRNKYNIESKCNLLDKIDFSSNLDKQKEVEIVYLQKCFLKAMQNKMSKEESKKKLIEYIYLFRYYKMLYFNKEVQIKDVLALKEYFLMAERYVITRGCNLKIINIFSHNIEKNYEIISKIFDSTIIDLDELNIEFKKKDGKILLNIFDDNMIDKTIEYSEKDDINIKLGKKVKLFI